MRLQQEGLSKDDICVESPPEGVDMMDHRNGQNAWVYVIDENFQIVYSNDNSKVAVGQLQSGEPCYRAICREEDQCQKCPLRAENHGWSILFDGLHEEWVSVSAAPVEWPGVGKCHMILCDRVDENDQNFFHNAIGHSEYNELLELNFRRDAYQVIYHGVGANRKEVPGGTISGAVGSIAQRQIHPEDRARFHQFWGTDLVGRSGVPESWKSMRHSEFRRLNERGNYVWVQQVLLPVRQSAEDTIVMLSFYQAIDMPEAREAAAAAAGLANRETFFKRVGEVLGQVEERASWCVVAIDIGQFKLFNEWYGHDAGNRLLTSVSACLDGFQDRGPGTGRGGPPQR